MIILRCHLCKIVLFPYHVCSLDCRVYEPLSLQVKYAELQNLPTNTRGYSVDQDATTLYTQVI